MNILYISLHPPLDPDRIATGNQVRDAGIIAALEAAGHRVERIAPLPEGREEGEGFFGSQQELARIVAGSEAEAILVGYWWLLAQLPATRAPVIVDFIAPRLLEALYEEDGTLQQESRRLLSLLPRADHFLVGNRRQGDMLLTLLLLAGIGCRDKAPISIVPISVNGQPDDFTPPSGEIRLVSAGVDWPWRDSSAWVEAVEDYTRRHPSVRLTHVTGAYPDNCRNGESALLSYRRMRSLLGQSHIGLEVGKRNMEREFSQSFRLAEYLQAGLPVILNSWLPAAGSVRDWNAGWIVDEPARLAELLDRLCRHPREIEEKAAGARRLATESLNYAQSCAPLLDYLASPWQPGKEAMPELVPPPDDGEATNVKWKYMLGLLYRFFFCRRRPERTPDILMVTRGDLFPADHGAAVKILRTAESLSRLDRDVFLTTDDRRRYFRFHQGEMQTLKFPLWLRFFALPRAVALLRLLSRGYPWRNAFLYTPVTDISYIFRTLYLATRFPIGAWHAEFPAYVRPLRFARSLFGGKLLLVEHNIEYELIRSQVGNLSVKAWRRLKALELHMCRLADVVVTVSDNDRQTLVADGIDAWKIHTIPHGVDLAAFRDSEVTDIRREYGIPGHHSLLVYHGTYSYPPNLEAMSVMADEILPRLRARGLAVSVLAIGSRPPDYPLHRDIHFTGSVAGLAGYLPAADMAVVPLQAGGGTRMKILDYFAAGIPVISTGKGIEGLPVKNGVEVIVRDDFDEICAAIQHLIEDPEARAELSAAGRAFVKELGWDAIAERYLPLLRTDPGSVGPEAGKEMAKASARGN